MKRTILTFSLLASAVLYAQETFTISECYRLARENYPMIRQFNLIKESEKYDLENAVTGYLPQFSINANAMYLSDVPKLGGPGGPKMPQGQYRANIVATQVIWDGGEISAKRRVTSAQARSEIENNEVVLYELNDRVNRLFFGILLQNESLVQNHVYQADIQVAIDKISSMKANGVANDYDLNQMKVELLNAKQSESEILTTRNAYARMLSLLINREIGSDTRLEIPKAAEELRAEISRPELDYYLAKEEYYEAQSDTVDSGLMPKISLFGVGGYGRPSLSSISSENFYGLGGISLTWSFGNYYTDKNEKLKIAASRKSVRAEAETFIFNTRLQMLQEDGEIKKVAELLKNDAEIVALRKSIRDSAFSKMQNGTLSVIDYIREMNAKEMADQRMIYHRIEKLSREYNYKYLTNN